MLDDSQEHASQMEAATTALKTGSLLNLQNQIKEKNEHLQEVQARLKELDEKAYANEEELKAKLQ